MYKGAVFFDYDGTLTDEREGIFFPTEKTIETLKGLRANGYLTVIATGRMKPLTVQVSDLFSGYVTSDGSYAEIDGVTVCDRLIDGDIQHEAMKFCEENGMYYALERQNAAYTNGTEDKHFLDMLDNFKLSRKYYRPLSEQPNVRANKMMVSYEDENAVKAFAERFRGRLTVSPHRFFLSADVDACGITKAVGIKAIIEHLGMDIDNTYAIGDGTNDVAMIKTVGHGVAMGNHTPLLDGVAEFYTKSVAGEGVYRAFHDHYKLFGI